MSECEIALGGRDRDLLWCLTHDRPEIECHRMEISELAARVKFLESFLVIDPPPSWKETK